MKKYLIGFSVLLIVVILISCEKTKSEIEILPSYYKEYNMYSMLGKTNAVFADSTYEKTLKQDLINFTRKLEPDAGKTPTVFSINYNIYISEKGEIDKIKNNATYRNYISLLNSDIPFTFYNNDQKQDEKFVEFIKLWKFKPAVINKKPIKSVGNFEASVKYYSTDSVEVFIYTTLSYLSDEERQFNIAVEEMPQPIGGIAGIQSKITYPEIARRAGIQGRVFIKAFINENGDVVKTEIIKGIGAGCDETAAAAVKETKFIPGKHDGIPVKVQVSVPILFKIQ